MTLRAYALTYPQLMNQALAKGFPEGDLVRIKKAFDLALRMFDGFYRAQGSPFLCHLTRTASIVLSEGLPTDTVIAALLHAAYQHGCFSDHGIGKATPAHRREVELVAGPQTEALIHAYQALPWRDGHHCLVSVSQLSTADEIARQLLAIRLANELEDFLDLGMAYRGCFPLGEYVAGSRDTVIQIAHALGHPQLAQELDEVISANLRCHLSDRLTHRQMESYELPSHHSLRIGFLERRKRQFANYLRRLVRTEL